MRFYTSMNPPPIIPHPTCSEESDVYKEFIDKNGKHEYKFVEKQNFHEKIQEASKSALSVKEFMDKYGLTVKDLPEAQLVDIIDDYTEIPTSYSEAANAIATAHNEFSLLSPAQKAMFNNNVNEFLASAVNGTIYDKLNLKQSVVEQKVNVALQRPENVSDSQNLSSNVQKVDTTKVHNISEGVKYE